MASFKKHTRIWAPVVFLVLLWTAITSLRLIDPIVLPTPWSIVAAIPRMLHDRLLADVGLTLARVLGALAIACLFGVPLGLLLGYKKRVYQMVEGPLHALRSIPASALFPLF